MKDNAGERDRQTDKETQRHRETQRDRHRDRDFSSGREKKTEGQESPPRTRLTRKRAGLRGVGGGGWGGVIGNGQGHLIQHCSKSPCCFLSDYNSSNLTSAMVRGQVLWCVGLGVSVAGLLAVHSFCCCFSLLGSRLF